MAALSESDQAQLKAQLQNAVVSCTERCLYQSAKWAAELLNSLDTNDLTYGSDTDVDSPMSDEQDSPPKPPRLDIKHDARESRLEAKERDRFLLAKTFFDCREFERCAAVFLPHTLPTAPLASDPQSPVDRRKSGLGKGKAKQDTPKKEQVSQPLNLGNISQKSLFLALYAKYMSGEKRKDEESEMILGPSDGGGTINKELNGVASVLEQWFSGEREGQGWLEYLYGVVLSKGKNEDDAKNWLLKSIHLFPYNWGAWQELGNLIGTKEELDVLLPNLPQNIMSFIFHVHISQELFQTNEAVHSTLSSMQSIFPHSAFLKSQRALLYYHNKDFDDADEIFSEILASDPHRLDCLDAYSNVLYVMNQRPKLAFLAHLATATSKFRPETCCIVGNYYSLLSSHEKAVMYFRRALTLDRSFLSAWTLMGHEYVEMKNTHAAIESYRRAVDVNRKDYRAWYGLGQTYEVLEMHSYALYYYQRAASLRPYDGKMWQAVGACYARVGKVQNGIRALKRALVVSSSTDLGSSFGSEGNTSGILDPETLYQIAVLYERLGDLDECAAYMSLTMAQEEGPEEDDGPLTPKEPAGVGVTPTTSKARMWLAKWEFSNGNWQRSMELANELCQDGVGVEDAKALVRDIRARIEAEREEGGRSSDI